MSKIIINELIQQRKILNSYKFYGYLLVKKKTIDGKSILFFYKIVKWSNTLR